MQYALHCNCKSEGGSDRQPGCKWGGCKDKESRWLQEGWGRAKSKGGRGRYLSCRASKSQSNPLGSSAKKEQCGSLWLSFLPLQQQLLLMMLLLWRQPCNLLQRRGVGGFYTFQQISTRSWTDKPKPLKSRYGGGHGGYGGGGKGTGTACVVKGSYCNCHYCKVITHLCLPQQTLTIQSNLSLLCLLS